MDGPRILGELKRDAFGRVELVQGTHGLLARRVASGSRLLGSGFVARRLMGRERRALAALDGALDVPTCVNDPAAAALPSADGNVPRAGDVLLRTWQPGAALHLAQVLPRDFFDRLDDLVRRVHARGVCHNDLHKEQNVIVGVDGYPALIDFQLASVHPRRGRRFRSRCAEDLRHLAKHRRRYTRDGRGPAAAGAGGAGRGRRRGLVAQLWKRLGKPVYLLVTRRVLCRADAEERRPSSGPWPRWSEPLGPRSA